MKLNDWESEYNHIVRFILRRMEPDTLEFFNDKKEYLVRSLELFHAFDTELFKKHYKDKKQIFVIRYKEFDYLIRKYIKICKKENNHFAGLVFFIVFTDMQRCFKVEYSKHRLYDISNYSRPATQEEKEYAEKTFPHEHFTFLDNYTEILEYKGVKIYVYTSWDLGFMLDWQGKVKQFELVWDWWYPIDTYIYLEKGWKFDDLPTKEE